MSGEDTWACNPFNKCLKCSVSTFPSVHLSQSAKVSARWKATRCQNILFGRWKLRVHGQFQGLGRSRRTVPNGKSGTGGNTRLSKQLVLEEEGDMRSLMTRAMAETEMDLRQERR